MLWDLGKRRGTICGLVDGIWKAGRRLLLATCWFLLATEVEEERVDGALLRRRLMRLDDQRTILCAGLFKVHSRSPSSISPSTTVDSLPPFVVSPREYLKFHPQASLLIVSSFLIDCLGLRATISHNHPVWM